MKNGEQTNFDTCIFIVTPENVRFSYKLAGPHIRALSFFYDSVFLFLSIIFFAFIIFTIGPLIRKYIISIPNFDQGIFWVGSCLIFWFQNAVLETVFKGQTPGKKLCGLRVLSQDGQPITGFQALTRNIIRAADIALGPFSFLQMSLNDHFMRLGDIAAQTIVVYQTKVNNTKLFRFKHPDIIRLINALPPDFFVSPDLKKALALYVKTRSRLSPQRNLEITGPLGRTLIQKAGLPENTNIDHFLCALYQWSSN